jgi:hypothetical protein
MNLGSNLGMELDAVKWRTVSCGPVTGTAHAGPYTSNTVEPRLRDTRS